MHRRNRRAIGLLALGIVTLCAVIFVVGNLHTPSEPTSPVAYDGGGDRILVDKLAYHFGDPKSGDVVLFRYPLDEKRNFIKRLDTLPADRKK